MNMSYLYFKKIVYTIKWRQGKRFGFFWTFYATLEIILLLEIMFSVKFQFVK
jgi:hypothetical protein